MMRTVGSSDDDRALFRAWIDGDRSAGDQLVQRHFDMVFRFFRTKSEIEAEDLTQRTFLACVENRERLWSTSTFRSFLLGIARMVLQAWLRDRKRRPGAVDLAEISMAMVQTTPSKAVAKHERGAQVLAALQTLPVDFQIAVELYYWEELRYEEIASVLEVSMGTVKSRLNRAKARLKDELGVEL